MSAGETFIFYDALVLAGWLIWLSTAEARAERRERKQAEWDAYIDQALALTDTDPFERWEADFR